MATEIKIRPMTLDDVRQVAQVHASSFPASRSTKLGLPFLQKIYEWYVLYQAKLSLVAIQDHKIVGFVSGTKGFGGGHRRFKYTFWYIALGFLRNPFLFLSRKMLDVAAVYIKALMPIYKKAHSKNAIADSPIPMKFALDSIAVHPNARGLNVGQALISAFEEAAASQGASYLSLGVERDNAAARGLYEKCGWKLSWESLRDNSAGYVKEMGRN